MSLFKAALLAVVPEEHLVSGLETQKLEGKVAFGCGDAEIFDRYQEPLSDGDIEVFICATPHQGGEPAATWRAIFSGHRTAIDEAHPDGMKYRPKTTASDTGWNCYWEVTNLRRLPDSEGTRIDKFRGYKKGNAYR